jgi:hypothetical protein
MGQLDRARGVRMSSGTGMGEGREGAGVWTALEM